MHHRSDFSRQHETEADMASDNTATDYNAAGASGFIGKIEARPRSS
ncbi:MAG: hypothetical protein IPJ06_18855 [Saprospiraceae bacterium]|nr:hypothetical protein [Saprospiraceae bacterium]